MLKRTCGVSLYIRSILSCLYLTYLDNKRLIRVKMIPKCDWNLESQIRGSLHIEISTCTYIYIYIYFIWRDYMYVCTKDFFYVRVTKIILPGSNVKHPNFVIRIIIMTMYVCNTYIYIPLHIMFLNEELRLHSGSNMSNLYFSI